MARPVNSFDNSEVQAMLEGYFYEGCKVGGHGEYRLPAAIDDSITGACWLNAEGYKRQAKLMPSKLFRILATLPTITAPEIANLFGKSRKTIILYKQGMNMRQAQYYAAAAKIASRSIKQHMEQNAPSFQSIGINAPI